MAQPPHRPTPSASPPARRLHTSSEATHLNAPEYGTISAEFSSHLLHASTAGVPPPGGEYGQVDVPSGLIRV